MVGLAILLLVGLALAWGVVVAWTILTLLRPPRRTYASALARGRPGDPGELSPGPTGQRPWTSWTLRWNTLDLPVWEIRGDAPDMPLIVLTHGWGDSRVGGLARAEHLLPVASSVVLWDMPAHGEAPGLCALGAREPDALRALLEVLASRAGEGNASSPRPVVLVGWSLGAGVSLVAARGEGERRAPPIVGVVAEAPYRLADTPARRMLVSMGLPHAATLPPALWLVGLWAGVGARWPGFDRAAFAKRLREPPPIPLLVLHGADDQISPPQDGREIAEAGGGEFVAVPGAGHAGLWTDPRHAGEVGARVRAWIAGLANPAATPPSTPPTLTPSMQDASPAESRTTST